MFRTSHPISLGRVEVLNEEEMFAAGLACTSCFVCGPALEVKDMWADGVLQAATSEARRHGDLGELLTTPYHILDMEKPGFKEVRVKQDDNKSYIS